MNIDLGKLKKLLNEEIIRQKIEEELNKSSSADDALLVLKTLMSLNPAQFQDKFKDRTGTTGIINTFKYMQDISGKLAQTQPLDLSNPEQESELANKLSDQTVRNAVIQLMEDLSMKDEYQNILERFMKNVSEMSRKVPRPVTFEPKE